MKLTKRTSLLPTQRIVFLPTALDSVRMVARRGMTDSEICQSFGIPESLFKKWLGAYPSFRAALEEGRTEADVKVVQALHKNAVGHTLKDRKVTVIEKNGKKIKRIVETQRHIPASTEAQKFWLTNRDKKHWKNRVSSESDIKASLVLEDRRTLINGIFTELIKDPSKIIDVTPEPVKDKNDSK